jgi:hypothetical protein
MYEEELAQTGGLVAIGGYVFDVTQVIILGAVLIVTGLLLTRLAARKQ